MIYLYLKTHNKTGLKYLGKTSAKDPIKYTGSGKYWKNHIKKHGYDVTTEILFFSDNADEIKNTGLHYSKIWDVVKSNEFANLKDECGDGGWEYCNSDPGVLAGRKVRMLTNNPFKDKKHTEETKQIIKEKRSLQVMNPVKEETKAKISQTLMNHVVSDETKEKIRSANIGRPPSQSVIDRMNSKVSCPHCSKLGNPAVMRRWHFDKCKFKKDTK